MSNSQNAWAIRTSAGLMAVALVLAVAAANLSRNSMSAAVARSQSAAQLPQAPSALREVVVEVLAERPGGGYQGRVLTKLNDRYGRTDMMMAFTVPDATPFVMGVAGDLHVGAIVHLRGPQPEGDAPLIANRVVILTTNIQLPAEGAAP